MPHNYRRNFSGKQSFFYFDLADESHQKLIKKAKKLNPMQTVQHVTKLDEY